MSAGRADGMSYEVVERIRKTAGRPVGWRSPLTLALLQTLETGKAISVPLNGSTHRKVQSRVIQAGMRYGYKACTRLTDGGVIAWFERRPATNGSAT